MMDLKKKEKDKLVKIAYWYYKRHMTQSDIAKRLGMTRQKVNMLIGELEDLGIVEIRINGMLDDFSELEYTLEKHYGIKQVSILDVNSTDKECLENFGRKAAEIISVLLEDGQTTGLSWGSTLGETIRYLKTRNFKNSMVVQLVGGLNSNSKIVRPDEITRLMATKLGCDFKILYAPALVDSKEAKEIILKENSISNTFDVMQKCDLVLLGVGELNKEATISKEGFMPQERLNKLILEGGVGDIAMLPYKEDGTWLNNDNLIGVDSKTLEQVPNVVIMACGENKADAVTGAIKTGCVNTVIIDKGIANAIALKQGLLK